MLWWRSVGSSHTAYSTEVFLDLVAKAGNQDPVDLRLELLADKPRHSGMLRLALYGEITLKDGVVVRGNFDGFPLLRINEMPRV